MRFSQRNILFKKWRRKPQRETTRNSSEWKRDIQISKHPRTVASRIKSPYSADSSRPPPLHLPCATWIFRAVVRVNTAPHTGHSALATTPDFSRWCRKRLLKVENSRPLQPWSQHCGRGLELTTRTCRSLSDPGKDSGGEKTESATIEDACEAIDEGWEELNSGVSKSLSRNTLGGSTHGIGGASGR